MTFGPSSAMARKLEHWRPDELPSKGAIYAKYGDLPSRELAITSAAVLDVALAQLLTMRLAGCGKTLVFSCSLGYIGITI
jgi:hypothetical protein